MRCPTVKRLIAAFPRLTVSEARAIRRLAWKASGSRQWSPDTSKPTGWLLRREIEDHHHATAAWVATFRGGPFSNPYDREVDRVSIALHAMNVIMGTYGVEALATDRERNTMPGIPSWEYLNAGDTYTATLIYSRRRGADALYIGCWGTIVEAHPHLFRE